MKTKPTPCPANLSVNKPWKPKKCDRTLFPDPADGPQLPCTIANVRHKLTENKITVRYNVIKKGIEIRIPGLRSTPDNGHNVANAYVHSLAKLNGLSTSHLDQFLGAIADENAFNPAADWIRSKEWDGIDRLEAFYATLTAEDGFLEGLKRRLLYKWLLSVVAAALKESGFRCRGVLTLQGPQGIGKTRWGKSLINDPLLADSLIKTDHHLDGGNKDSLIAAVTHWIVEIGELESSFRRDVARLKGFLTADFDKVRRPYAKVDSEYPRRTVFYATVNQGDFLVDLTGNTRWWTIPVVAVDHDHSIDMQQLFAQLAVDFEAGAEWWLDEEEETMLERQNSRHVSYSLVADRLSAVVDFDRPPNEGDQSFTASELLDYVGLERPTNAQARECGAILRSRFGSPRRSRGRDVWRIPLQPSDDRVQPSSGRPSRSDFD